MNSYIPLCFIALAATIRTMPTIYDLNEKLMYYNNSIDFGDNQNFLLNNDLQIDSYNQPKTLRHVKHLIDGLIHHIKAAGVTYRQRLRDDQCFVEYDSLYLTESSVIQIRKKLYRVENCLLERVFHACGPNLLIMLNVVCRVVEHHQTTTTTATTTTLPTNLQGEIFHRLSPRASKTPRVITESCCENLCTISELSRYCHR